MTYRVSFHIKDTDAIPEIIENSHRSAIKKIKEACTEGLTVEINARKDRIYPAHTITHVDIERI